MPKARPGATHWALQMFSMDFAMESVNQAYYSGLGQGCGILSFLYKKIEQHAAQAPALRERYLNFRHFKLYQPKADKVHL